MKKLTNTVRIEMVPRADIAPKVNGELFSPDNHQQVCISIQFSIDIFSLIVACTEESWNI